MPNTVRVKIALLGKATVILTVDVERWATEYGIEPTAEAVAKDVRAYYDPTLVEEAVREAIVKPHLANIVTVSA